MFKEKVSRLNYSDFQEVVNQNFVVRRNWNKGSRTHNGTVDFDTKWSYLVIHPNETKTIKLRDFSDELGGGGFRVSLKLQSYSRYDDYERIYK